MTTVKKKKRRKHWKLKDYYRSENGEKGQWMAWPKIKVREHDFCKLTRQEVNFHYIFK